MPFGRVKTDFGLRATNDVARDMVIQSDGKIIVVGGVDGQIALLRYNADGTLDTTFSGDGKVNTLNPSASGTAFAVNLQGDGKIVVAVDVGGTDFKLARFNVDGTLDIGFGSLGFVTTDMGASDFARDVIVQADGKIIVVGGNGADFAIARYTSSGAPDLTFAGTGTRTINIGNVDAATGVVLQADSKIVVAGSSFVGQSANFSLARIDSNGNLDTSFSFDGLTDTTFGSDDVATSMALQADGKYVVAGYTNINNATLGPNDFAVARFNADGSLDTSFSGDGLLTTDFGNDDRANSVALQNDGKILVAGSWDGGASDFAIVRYNSDGSLDTTFSVDGKANLTFGLSSFGGSEFAYSIKVQADGKILISGTTDSSTSAGDNDFALARLNADGSLDTSFGGTGKIKTDVGLIATSDTARDVAIQSDGKFVVAGSTGGSIALARYNADGTLDTNFSNDGKVTGPALTSAFGVSLQADGKIVVAGVSAGGADFLVGRYNSNGTVDTAFGTGGFLTVDFGGLDLGRDVVIQADGKIIVMGSSGTDFAIARFNADGTADLGFGAAGKLITNASGTDNGAAVIVQSDGKIVIAGSNLIGSSANFCVVRYTENGSLDTSFSVDGIAEDSFGGEDIATSIALQANGKLVVAGYTNANGLNDFAVARYNTDGSLDTSFSIDGKTTTSFGDDDRANTVVIQSDGKILVAGSFDGGASDFAIVRYNTDGFLDTTFSSDGRANFAFGSGTFGTAEFAFSIKLQADGKILVVGGTNSDTTDSDEDFAIARLNADGSLDATFVGNGETWVGTAAGDLHTGSGTGDVLSGLGGDDLLFGDRGDDTLRGGFDNDTLIGGDGNDTADYSDAAGSGININLATLSVQNVGGGLGIDTLSDIENLIGSRFGDNLTGNDGVNAIEGRDGDDVIVGGAGGDRLNGGANTTLGDTLSYFGSLAVVVNLATSTATDGDATGDVISNFENVSGSSFNDQITGNTGDNRLSGGSGDDNLNGGLGADALNGDGGSNDTADYRTSTGSNVSVSLLADTASGGEAAGDTLDNIENLFGSLTLRDVLIGDNGANVLKGFGGTDSLRGEGGDDYLDGGAGGDALNAGAGSNDWAGYRDNVSADIRVDLTLNTATGGDAAGDTLFFVENLEGSLTRRDILIGNLVANTLVGNGGSDIIRGEAGNDIIEGGTGADSLNAGAGIDTAVYEHSSAGVTVNLNVSLQTSGGEASGDSLFFFENITGSGFDDSLSGNVFSNRLVGGAGADTLNGALGSDFLTGGLGADTFRFQDMSFGSDTILDWQDGVDHISVALPLETNFAGLTFTGNGTTQVVVRGFNGTGSAIIVKAGAGFVLDVSDFVFV